MTHVFRNALSGIVLGIYQGSLSESIEVKARAAGVNLVFYDIVESNEDSTSLARKDLSSFLENKHPLSTHRSLKLDLRGLLPAGFNAPPPPFYPPPGWRRFYKEFRGLVERTALHKFLPQTRNVADDAAIKACAAVLQWQAFEIRMDYIEVELTKGNVFQRFSRCDDGYPNEPVKARTYDGCLLSVCRSLCISEEEGRAFIDAVVKEAEGSRIIEIIKEMVHKDGTYAYFA